MQAVLRASQARAYVQPPGAQVRMRQAERGFLL